MSVEVEADEAAREAVAVAAAEIRRLAKQQREGKAVSGFDAMDLEKFAAICLRYDHHRMTWMQKMDPEKLPDELLRRWTKAMGEDERPAKRRS